MKGISGTVASSELFYKAVTGEEEAEGASPHEFNISQSSGRVTSVSVLILCHGAAAECCDLSFCKISQKLNLQGAIQDMK